MFALVLDTMPRISKVLREATNERSSSLTHQYVGDTAIGVLYIYVHGGNREEAVVCHMEKFNHYKEVRDYFLVGSKNENYSRCPFCGSRNVIGFSLLTLVD